jgi:hypothetical protein
MKFSIIRLFNLLFVLLGIVGIIWGFLIGNDVLISIGFWSFLAAIIVRIIRFLFRD